MKCEKCKKEHDGSFGSGRFCNRSCANSRIYNNELRKKKSIAGLKYYSTHEHIMKGKPGCLHTEETKNKLSKIGKIKWKKGLIFKIPGNAHQRKLEKIWNSKIERYFNTKNLKPKKIGNHWFDFVNTKFIIEFTIDKTAGISDAIKRFETIKNDKRKKFLLCYDIWFGKKRKNRLYLTGAKFVDMNMLVVV